MPCVRPVTISLQRNSLLNPTTTCVSPIPLQFRAGENPKSRCSLTTICRIPKAKTGYISMHLRKKELPLGIAIPAHDSLLVNWTGNVVKLLEGSGAPDELKENRLKNASWMKKTALKAQVCCLVQRLQYYKIPADGEGHSINLQSSGLRQLSEQSSP